MGNGSSAEATLTRFYILQPEEGSNAMRWLYRGDVLARDREHAARLFFGAPGDEAVDYVAVSENAWKPVTRPARVVKPAPRPIPMPRSVKAEDAPRQEALA